MPKQFALLEQKLQVDAIVNSVHFKQHHEGNIASSLSKSGGKAYQTECKSAFKKMTNDDIAITDGKYFGCKKVYHIPFLSSDRSLQSLKAKLLECLRLASKAQMNSIAIPVIGIDENHLHYNQIARETFRVIINFAQENQSSQKLILIQIVIDNNARCHQAFQKVLKAVNEQQLSLDENTEISLITQNFNQTTKEQSPLSNAVFIAECDNYQESCKVCVEYGTTLHTESQVLIDITNLCSQHLISSKLTENFRFPTSDHTSETIQFDPSCTETPQLCQVCPYGLIAGFGVLLTCLNASGRKSILCPLLNVDFSREDIHKLILKYELFLNQHKSHKSKINCIRFLMGQKQRALETATWIRQYIRQNPKLQWKITHDIHEDVDGIKILIAAYDQETIFKIQSKIEECVPSWTTQILPVDNYICNMENDHWHRYALELWCKYNTFISRKPKQDSSRNLLLYGFNNDITNAISEIRQLTKLKLEQFAIKEEQELNVNSVAWVLKVGNISYPFDQKLNYQIEKNYKNFEKTKNCQRINNFSFYIRAIDYKNMKIETRYDWQYSIDRIIYQGLNYVGRYLKCVSVEDIDVPDYWQYDSIDEVKYGPPRIMDVVNEKERKELFDLIGSRGIKVTKFQRVQNWNLYYHFQQRKKEIEASVIKYKASVPVERRLFHGTKSQNVENICRAGFDINNCGNALGFLYGKGVYFANQPKKALRYGNKLLLVRVLTGIYAQSNCRDKPNLQTIPGSPAKRVHSSVDQFRNPTIFVISNDNAAYPEYILHGYY
ncbi:uncharacterized protein TRIADDRAFT_58775 [Trichoplax adhaerens]|uniref:Poly [ADP-ribose] polymerase n=1 Tax=Trichoplax adhaerens TaxID=10228 RepID=B3S3M3_TRIAD|nr:hypothetical protein TRIADDRAFT_58775 [Trichoplax adhaerens]EDV22828.1 hypothetical protein TRIADDRAFT_58775 [Trichoplax adhaerens]|eukprot:XP_002114694.1 hypothetical protein TRIADDRAFT_58775 [Trichoplax adhaerens]